MCVLRTAQNPHTVCSLSSASCLPHFPSFLQGCFRECSVQNPWLREGFGKSVDECSLPTSSLYCIPHSERQPPKYKQKQNKTKGSPPTSISMQAPSAYQAKNSLAVVTMVTVLLLGPPQPVRCLLEAASLAAHRPPPKLRTILLFLPSVPSTVPGTQWLMGMSCLSGDPQAVLGQTGLV